MSYQNDQRTSSGGVDPIAIIGLAGGIVYALGAFLPYVTVSFLGASQSMSIKDGGGITWVVILVLGLAGAAVSFTRKPIPVIGVGAASLAFALLGLSKFKSSFDSASTVTKKLVENMMSYGVGFYFLLIGPAVLIIAGIIMIVKKN